MSPASPVSSAAGGRRISRSGDEPWRESCSISVSQFTDQYYLRSGEQKTKRKRTGSRTRSASPRNPHAESTHDNPANISPMEGAEGNTKPTIRVPPVGASSTRGGAPEGSSRTRTAALPSHIGLPTDERLMIRTHHVKEMSPGRYICPSLPAHWELACLPAR
jgi:hypothetical protein